MSILGNVVKGAAIVFGSYMVCGVAGAMVGTAVAKKTDDPLETAVNEAEATFTGALVGAVTGIIAGGVITYKVLSQDE